jgi:N-acetylmuramoyl-L-alanine amidase
MHGVLREQSGHGGRRALSGAPWCGPIGVLWLFLALILMPALAHAEATVRDVRIRANGDTTRVVLDLSRKVSYRHLTLDGPTRLAIDLPEVAWLLPDSFGQQPVGLVKGFRFGRLRPGVSRLAVDVDGPFEIENIFELPANERYGHRIVTDLRRVDAAQWAAGDTLAGGIENAALTAPPFADPDAAAPEADAGTNGHTTAFAVPLRMPPMRKPEPPSTRRWTVVIDPGHGGIDPGAIGSSGIYEKDIVIAMAEELHRRLEATDRFDVVMTREGDRTVRLRDRLRIAHEAGGELFISLHADSLVQAPQVRGAAVYTLSEEASTAEAARLATKENRADILNGIDLSEHEDIVSQILIDLAQRDANNRSLRVAEVLVEALAETTRLARHTRQSAGFVVLKSPDMPSVLIELGYLSNDVDERQLTDSAYIKKLAGVMARAIESFFAAEVVP